MVSLDQSMSDKVRKAFDLSGEPDKVREKYGTRGQYTYYGARIGWEPFMFNPSLPYLLRGVKTPTLLVAGTRDEFVPRGCIDAYRKAISGAQVAEIKGAGHRPEIENEAEFVQAVKKFLAA